MRLHFTRREFLILGLGLSVGWKSVSASSAHERTPLESSSIARAGYDAAARALELEFRDGSIYRYRDVPREIFDGLMNAGSKGRYFIERIRGKFDYERVTTALP
jgi:hypothetical protein